MRSGHLALGLALLACACAPMPGEDLSILMGTPAETGFVLIDCCMMMKADKMFAFDKTEPISPDGCSIVAKDGENQPIWAKRMAGIWSADGTRVWFIFPKLQPGLYCLRSINGGFIRTTPAEEEGGFPRIESCQYTYSFPAWSLRDVVFEVSAGVPTYFGEVVLTEPYSEYVPDKREVTVTRIGTSVPASGSLVEVVYSPKGERTAWTVLLDKYEESLWSGAIRARLDVLSNK